MRYSPRPSAWHENEALALAEIFVVFGTTAASGELFVITKPHCPIPELLTTHKEEGYTQYKEKDLYIC